MGWSFPKTPQSHCTSPHVLLAIAVSQEELLSGSFSAGLGAQLPPSINYKASEHKPKQQLHESPAAARVGRASRGLEGGGGGFSPLAHPGLGDRISPGQSTGRDGARRDGRTTAAKGSARTGWAAPGPSPRSRAGTAACWSRGVGKISAGRVFPRSVAG